MPRRVTLSEKDAPLEKVLQEIKKQTGYDFVFTQKQLEGTSPVSIQVNKASLEEVLDICFKDQPFTYEIVNKIVLVSERKGQAKVRDTARRPEPTIDIHGKVTDSLGNPLSGAVIEVEGTKKGATTDENGEFESKGVDKEAILVVSFVGYGTQKIRIGGRKDVTIALHISNLETAQVSVEVNTWYQKIPKERATGAFVIVDNELFNRRVGTDVLSRLEGAGKGRINLISNLSL